MAAEQLTDQEKEFRRRARRRLIGAVALVLLMVTLLPLFLDDRSDQNMPATDVAISIPSQDDNNFASKIVPVAPTPAAPEASSPSAAPAPAETPEQPAKTSEKPVQLEAPIAPAVKEIAQKSDKVEKPAADKTSPKKGMVSVQIGVFTDPAKVKQVQAKIAALGLQTSTETLNSPTGPKLRMRSGPYATKAEAEQALETLKGAGFSPILVTH